ncbi:MAG: hypothetical protein NC203_06010, partial [Firmicutes bacterium]|nr:hypothetical protein [Bacillota bacterium]
TVMRKSPVFCWTFSTGCHNQVIDLIMNYTQSINFRSTAKNFYTLIEISITYYRGLAQVGKWVRLKFAAMNLKKYAIHRWNMGGNVGNSVSIYYFFLFWCIVEKLV